MDKSAMNVHDFLKEKSVEEIKQFCADHAFSAAVAMFNVDYDFNCSSLLRSGNCFGMKEMFHIQKEGRRMDRRGAVGAQNYTDLTHFYNEDEFFSAIENKYVPIAVENNLDFVTENAFNFVFPKNSCLIFGAENKGLSDSVLKKCKNIITIPNFGCIRSLNVGCTAAIIMALYSQQQSH